MEEKEDMLTVVDQVYDELFKEHYTRFRWLRKYGPNAFEADGSLITTTDGREKINNGREFILRTLAFFQAQDDSFCYKTCASLKKVLDDYDVRFNITADEKIKSGKRFDAFIDEDRERKEFVDEARSMYVGKN